MARVRPETAETTATGSRPVASPGMIVPAADDVAAPSAMTRRKPRDGDVASSRELAPRESAPRGKGSAKRRREAAAAPSSPHMAQGMLIGALASCGFTMVALATWSPADPSLSVSGSGPVANLGGPLGAYLADLLYQGLGWGAWSVLVVAAWLILRLAGRLAGSAWNVVLGGLATWMLSAGFDLALGHDATRAFPPGGLLGILTADLLRENVGPAGAALAVGTGLVLTTTVLFGINWQPIAAGTVDRVQAGVPRAGRLLGVAAGAAGRGALAAGSRAGEALRARLRRDDDEDDDYVDDDNAGEELAIGTAPTPGLPVFTSPPSLPVSASPAAERLPGTSRAGRRPVEPEVEPRVEDLPSIHASVWSARPAPAPRVSLDAPPPERPTEVSGRTLVEAAWEDERLGDRPSFARPAPRPPTRVTTAPPVPAPSAYDVPLPRHAAPPAAVCDPIEDIDDIDESADDLDSIEDFSAPGLRRSGLDDPPSNAFGVATSPEAAPHAAIPSVPAASSAPPTESQRCIVPPELPPTPVAKKGKKVAVVPGELASGGVHDDGGAVRETSSPFQLPTLSLLDEPPPTIGSVDESKLHELANRIVLKLRDHRIEGKVTAIRPGPVITMFEYEPAPGIKLSAISSLQDDIVMALRAQSVRILAPIPGRGVVGFEVPNEKRQIVWARDVFASPEFRDTRHALPIMLGKDTEGRPYVADLARAPHLMIGGTTGSGKSVGVNSMLLSLLMTRAPDELRLILIDPKKLEFELYKDIPHLLHPVVTEPSLAARVLDWTCEEMDRRYRMLSDWKVRNIDSFNQKVEDESREWTPEKAKTYFPDWPAGQLIPAPKKLPFIVVVIDELADLMMTASKEVETSIARLAQKARASGIHIIVATQSPRRDVLTGLIKANLPTRLAYAVPRGLESKIILDMLGAETLLGKGDQLFVPPGSGAAVRIHGAFVSDNEVARIADFCRAQGKPNYAPAIRMEDLDDVIDDAMDELDEEMGRYYDEILELALEKGQISTSMIQRHLKLGYNRACLLMEHLEKNGIVGPADGAKPRKVIQHV